MGDTWLQTGRAAGSGEAYEYASRARDIGVPHVELAVPQIFVTVSSAFQGGWLAQSAVYGTPSGGAPTSRASRLTAPALGAMLSGFATFQWDTGSGVSKVRFTAGSEAGWTNLADQEYYSGTYSAQLFVPATGRKVFITLWSLIGTSWQANSYVFDTWNQNATVSASTAPAQLLLPTAPIANSTYTFQWIPGTGANLYWLSVGSTVDGTDYYNERNIGTSTLSATVRALPANNTRVYATLYSRINNTWIPYRASVIMAVRPVGEIPQQFLDCIKSGADPVCTLPEGTYYMWNTKATKVISVPGPSGSTTTLQLNAPIVIERSGITVHGTEPRPKLVRYDPALYLSINPAVPTPGCQHLMEIAPGVSNLIIENIEFEGSAGAYSGHCKPNSSAAAQPAAQDLSFQGQNSNVTIRDSEFRNAISTALLIYAPNIDGVTITGTRFVEPNLAGILVGNNFVWDGGSAPNYIPQHAFLLPNGQPGGCDVLAGGLPAAATADVPRNILISWNIFLRSWTGALALNRSRQVTVQYNSFTDNYQRPYDDGGGSMNTTECDYDTKIVGNIFNAAGLNLPEGKGTIALELSGIKEYVEGNTIQGYPSTMIVARNSKDLSIIGNNQLNGNGRLNFRTEDPVSTDARVRQDSGIELWNQYKFRAMTGVKIENNTIANPSMAGTFPYAIRVRRHSCSPVLAPDPGNQCSMSQTQSWVYGLRVKGNTFNNMSVAPYCIMSGVKPPQGLPEFPDWDLQGGWATCIEPLP